MIFGSGDGAVVVTNDEEVVLPVAPKAVDPELAELTSLGNIELALYTGQFTRDELSGIDMLIVGDINQTKLQKFMSALEDKEKKEIRYVAMNPTEFNYRMQVKDRFITNVLAAKKQVLIDKKQIIEEE